jgi:hypothetical protein
LIEVEDERVHRLVASATAAHLHRIEQFIGRIAKLEEELSNRVRQFHQLNFTVKDLNKQLKEARQQTRLARESHLATVMMNSQNSTLPPSTDPRKGTRSLREKCGRKLGGQVGHRGATKEFVEKPDHLVFHATEACSRCGSALEESEVKETISCEAEERVPEPL